MSTSVAPGLATNITRPAGVSASNINVCPPASGTDNASSVWANCDNTSSVVNFPELPGLDRRSGVAENCMKEVMTCEISPLGFHLAPGIKEKIWRQEYVDLLSLLLSSKEPSKSEKKF